MQAQPSLFFTDQVNTFMVHITEDQKKVMQQSNLRPYHRPRLFVYGAVRNLTAGGSGNANEGEMGNAKPRS